MVARLAFPIQQYVYIVTEEPFQHHADVNLAVVSGEIWDTISNIQHGSWA